MSQPNETQRQPELELEYEQVNDNFRFLADARFKLLALLPVLGGAAVFVLARIGLEAGKAPVASTGELLVVLLVSAFGFIATLGITLYDQRNSELYNALIHRAKYLEKTFDLPIAPGGLKQARHGGQFNERPGKARRLIFKVGHDLALALIYGPLLGAWSFPSLYAVLRLANIAHECSQVAAAIAAVATALAFTTWLAALDRQDFRLYAASAKRDGLDDERKDSPSGGQ
jgi:hypothetical protein